MQLHHDATELFKAAGAAGHPFYPSPTASMLHLQQQLQQQASRAAAGVDGDAASLASLPSPLQPFLPNPMVTLPSKGFTCPLCNKSGFSRLVQS